MQKLHEPNVCKLFGAYKGYGYSENCPICDLDRNTLKGRLTLRGLEEAAEVAKRAAGQNYTEYMLIESMVDSLKKDL